MRYYSSVAPQMALQGSVTSGNTTLTVDTVAGLPGSFPFTVVIDPGVGGEEICTVTNVSGLILTVTRGADGSSATSHSVGAVIRHMMTARDLQEPQTHINSTTGVHGAAGAVVGTTDTQTLTNKTISGSNNTITNVSGANISGANNVAKGVLPSDVTYNATAQTLTNKTIDASLNTLTNVPVSGANITGTNNVPKSVLPTDVVYLATAQTLTNKTLTSPTVNTPTITAPTVTSGITTDTLTGSGLVTATEFKATTFGTPVMAYGTSDAGYTVGNQWTDFGSGLAAFTFTVPQSGRVEITVTASLGNTLTSSSVNWLSYRIDGGVLTSPGSGATQTVFVGATGVAFQTTGIGHTTAVTQADWAVRGTGGGTRASASRIWGLTAGATITITPQYNVTPGSSATAFATTHFIQVKPLF